MFLRSLMVVILSKRATLVKICTKRTSKQMYYDRLDLLIFFKTYDKTRKTTRYLWII